MSTKKIVTTAMILALCIVFQSFKGISIYFTGSAVNALLVLATISVGLGSGLFIAVMTPMIAYFMGQTPIMQMIPLMIFVVMLGNAALVLMVGMAKGKRLPLWMVSGAVLKAAVLWGLVWFVVLPFFGAGVPEKMQIAVKASFSITQLITALIGCGAAYIVHGRVKFLYASVAR